MIKEKIQNWRQFRKIKKHYEEYERFLIPGMLVLGVIVDFVTFRAIQIRTAFIVLGVHLLIAAIIITYYNLYQAKKISHSVRLFKYLNLASPLILQFSFGALLSASLIFYWFSGSFSISWPFIILITMLIVSNETFREYYLRPTNQLAIFYFILFSILALILPFVFNSISAWVFVLSGVSSLVLIFLYLLFLAKLSDKISWHKSKIHIFIMVIFIAMNAMYFLNIIPPIPLAIRDAGVYHSVQRSGGGYLLLTEDKSFINRIIPGQTIHLVPGQRLYVYSSIFAPADLNTKIIHEWQYYDQGQRKWISKDKLSFGITGGRQDGYRGFSSKSSIPEGSWRVDVETERGQVIGRISFKVDHVEAKVVLEEIVK